MFDLAKTEIPFEKPQNRVKALKLAIYHLPSTYISKKARA